MFCYNAGMENDHQGTLKAITDLMRGLSRISDPQELIRTYKARAQVVLSVDRTLSLSRRDLSGGDYRITRSDIWAREVDPWKESDRLPLLHGGLLGELLYREEPRIIEDLQIASDDPAHEHLAGMRSLAAIPHFDNGTALNMVIHLRREPAAFDHNRFPDLVMTSGLFGRAMREIVLTNNLRRAQENLRENYGAVTELSDTILEQARALKNHSHTLEERVRQRTAELEESHLDAIYMLAAASEAKDGVTGDHIRRMQDYSARLARALGHDEREAVQIGRAAILHDVGKLHVPDDILKKPGPLTPQERTVMEQHTLTGEQILPDRPYFAQARRIARSHHENWDGTGYPDRLKGTQIPLEARLVHVADVYDALTHARPYKLPWGEEETRSFIEKESGKMFDPEAVEAFLGLRHGVGGAGARQAKVGVVG